jgi:hypothetical protein
MQQAVVLCCTTCGLVRICDGHSAARARGKAHTSLNANHAVTYSVIDAPERLQLAQAFEEQSRKAVKGYVEDSAFALA